MTRILRFADMGETVELRDVDLPVPEKSLSWKAKVESSANVRYELYLTVRPTGPFLRYRYGQWAISDAQPGLGYSYVIAQYMDIAATTVREAMQTFIAMEFML